MCVAVKILTFSDAFWHCYLCAGMEPICKSDLFLELRKAKSSLMKSQQGNVLVLLVEGMVFKW